MLLHSATKLCTSKLRQPTAAAVYVYLLALSNPRRCSAQACSRLVSLPLGEMDIGNSGTMHCSQISHF